MQMIMNSSLSARPAKKSTIDSNFFAQSIASTVGISTDLATNLWRDSIQNHPQSKQALEHFLCDPETALLVATCCTLADEDGKSSKSRLFLSNQVKPVHVELQFVSKDSSTIQSTAFVNCSSHSNLQVLSLPLSEQKEKEQELSLLSLRRLLQCVYIPLLRQVHPKERQHELFYQTVLGLSDQLLHELDRQADIDQDSRLSSHEDVFDFSLIRTPMDEIGFWELHCRPREQHQEVSRQYSENDITKDILYEICKAFRDAKETFQVLSQDSSSMEKSGMASSRLDSYSHVIHHFNTLAQELGENGVVECTLFHVFHLNSAGDRKVNHKQVLRKPVYSVERLKHMLDVLTSSLLRHIRRTLPRQQAVWYSEVPFYMFKSMFSSAIQLLKSFMQMVAKLTGTDLKCLPYPWRNEDRRSDDTHNDDGYQTAHAQKLCDRLGDMLTIRTVQEEIDNLITDRDRKRHLDSSHNLQLLKVRTPLRREA